MFFRVLPWPVFIRVLPCSSVFFRGSEFTRLTRGRHIRGPRSRACLTQSYFGADAGSMSPATLRPGSRIRESWKLVATAVPSEAMNAARVCGCGSCCRIAVRRARASNLHERGIGEADAPSGGVMKHAAPFSRRAVRRHMCLTSTGFRYPPSSFRLTREHSCGLDRRHQIPRAGLRGRSVGVGIQHAAFFAPWAIVSSSTSR